MLVAQHYCQTVISYINIFLKLISTPVINNMIYNIEPLTVLKVMLPSSGLVVDVCDYIHELYAVLTYNDLAKVPLKIHGMRTKFTGTPLRPICAIILLRFIKNHISDWGSKIVAAYNNLRDSDVTMRVVPDINDYISVNNIIIVGNIISFELQLHTLMASRNTYHRVEVSMGCFKIKNDYFRRNIDNMYVPQ